MRLPSERQLIADYGRRMTRDRLVVGTSGNLSIRSGDLLAVTPAGHAYDTLTPELVLEVEDLLQQDQPLVGGALQAGEEGGHLGLPAGVDLGGGHGLE